MVRTSRPVLTREEVHELLIDVEKASPIRVADSYLFKLKYVLKLRRVTRDEMNDKGDHLLDQSIFSAYVDCREVGKGTEARKLMAEHRLILEANTPENRLLRIEEYRKQKLRETAPKGTDY